MDEIRIQEYIPQDREQCIELLKRTFPGTSDEKTFAWRFETQREKEPLLICAKHQGKLVSFNSWLPWKFRYNNEIYWGFQSGESATDKQYRGKGIFAAVMEYANSIVSHKGVDFFFGFPSPMSYSSAYLAGYVPVATNYFCLHMFNPFSLKKMKANKFDKHISKTLSQHDKITPVVDENYEYWRYNLNAKEYEIIKYSEDNSEIKFYLRVTSWKKIPEIILLDFKTTTYNDSFIINAFRQINYKYSKKALYMRTFVNESTHRGMLIKKLFPICIEFKYYHTLVKNISGRIDSNILYNKHNWDIMPHCIDEL